MATIGYGYGSEWHLLQHLGRRRAAFTRRIQTLTGCTGIQWLDHDESEEPSTGWLTIREPRGLEFLASADPVRQEWERLWPHSGNVHNWDAVGRTATGTQSSWILVEAKAHLGELTSSCAATAETSRRRIRTPIQSWCFGGRMSWSQAMSLLPISSRASTRRTAER